MKYTLIDEVHGKQGLLEISQKIESRRKKTIVHIGDVRPDIVKHDSDYEIRNGETTLCSPEIFYNLFVGHACILVGNDPMAKLDYYHIDPRDPVIQQILEAFNKDRHRRFIVISGNMGSGKTTIVKALSGLLTGHANYFRVKNEIEILDEIGNHGYPALAKLRRGGLCIDDYGRRQNDRGVKYMGNQIDVIDNLVYTRIERGLFTFFTTNLLEANFLKLLSPQTQDRVSSSMNWITLTGKNRRR